MVHGTRYLASYERGRILSMIYLDYARYNQIIIYPWGLETNGNMYINYVITR